MRSLIQLLTMVGAVYLAAVPSSLAQDKAAVLTGKASVVDGDGIAFGEVEVRLQGIAAPELSEAMGPESFQALQKIVEGQEVVCDLDGTVANRRPVGICFVGMIEIGKAQVLTGMARDCPHYSKGRYREDEMETRKTALDLSAEYELPGYCK